VGEIDFDGPDPLYLQLAAVLRGRIQDGTYQVNRAIPSVAALIDEFGLSTMTVQKSLTVLKNEGLIRAVKGRGTFVKPQNGAPGDTG
jgi:DNA-binding GntR family transcriptional regulator